MSTGPSVEGTIGGNTAPLKKALNDAQSLVKNFASTAQRDFQDAAQGGSLLARSVSSIGVGASVAVGAVIALGVGFKNLMDRSGELKDLSLEFQTPTDSLQGLDYAAKISGTSLDKLGTVANKVTLAAQEAAGGSDELAQSFADLGINATKFLEADLEGKALMLADAYDAASGNAAKQAQLLKLIGTRGAEIFPMLVGGAESLSKAMAEINPISEETIDSLDAMGDRIERIKANLLASASAAVDFIEAYNRHIGEGLGEAIYGNADASLSPEFQKQQAKIAEQEKRRTANAAEAKKRAQEQEKNLQEKISKDEEDAAKKILATKESIAEIERQNHLDSLSAADKILAIEKEISGLKEMQGESSYDAERLGYQLQIVEKEKELAKAKEESNREAEQAAQKAEAAQKKAEQEAEQARDKELAQQKAIADQAKDTADSMKSQAESAKAIAESLDQARASNSLMSSEERGSAGRSQRRENRALERTRRLGGRDPKTGAITNADKAERQLQSDIRKGLITEEGAQPLQDEIENIRRGPQSSPDTGEKSLGEGRDGIPKDFAFKTDEEAGEAGKSKADPAKDTKTLEEIKSELVTLNSTIGPLAGKIEAA